MSIKKMLPRNTKEFIVRFLDKRIPIDLNRSALENPNSVGAAVFYEKIRVMLENQEDHLLFKNAVSRIARRHIYMSPKIDGALLAKQIINELVWANYVNADLLTEKQTAELQETSEKYLSLLRAARSERFNRTSIASFLINLMACEIDEKIWPHEENDELLRFSYLVINPNFNRTGINLNDFEHYAQVRLAIYTLLFKPDSASFSFETLKILYPSWPTNNHKDLILSGQNFDRLMDKISGLNENNYRPRYLAGVKKIIAPFIVLNSALKSGDLDEKTAEDETKILTLCMKTYYAIKTERRIRMWRGVLRSLVFILLTKLVLTVILEIPYDLWRYQEIYYPALVINLFFPPLLMLIAGLSIKPLPRKNDDVMKKTLTAILVENKIPDFKFRLLPPPVSKTLRFYEVVYSLLSLGVLILAIWGLVKLRFTFISIILFFIIVSAVAFFAFRIRNGSQMLLIDSKKHKGIEGMIEFLFLPFVRIGKKMSYQLAQFNPFLLALDFLIEAPLKTIIRIVRSFTRFVARKEEEIDY